MPGEGKTIGAGAERSLARGREAAADRTHLARGGEALAASHLESRGYRVLARNLRVRRDEIDLLALAPDGRTVVIVEVKTRDGDAHPEDRVDAAKRRRLSRAALALSTRPEFRRSLFRFDVIAIDSRELRHFEAAFDAEP